MANFDTVFSQHCSSKWMHHFIMLHDSEDVSARSYSSSDRQANPEVVRYLVAMRMIQETWTRQLM